VVAVLAVAAPAAADTLVVGGSGRGFEVRSDGASVRLRVAAPGGRFGSWRTVVRAGRGERVMDAAVTTAGSGIAFLQRRAPPQRSVEVAAFGAPARMTVSPRGADADFAASAVAPDGAAVVVWFRHRGDRRWRLEAAVREAGARTFGQAQPLSGFIRRACCTSVSAAIGGRGDAVVTWSSTARPSVWAALRRRGRGFGRARRLAGDAATAPQAVMGAGGTAVVTYSTQHVPLRAGDGLQLHRAASGDSFGAAEHVNPGGGVTIAGVAVAPSGDVTVAWRDEVHGARVHVSQSAGPLSSAAELGTNVAARAIAVDAADDGRTVVAWSERSGRSERATAAIRPVSGEPFGAPTTLGSSWRAAEPQLARLVPQGGALVLWQGARYRGPTARRTALAVTRLP
jgi:hypothetical protein